MSDNERLPEKARIFSGNSFDFLAIPVQTQAGERRSVVAALRPKFEDGENQKGVWYLQGPSGPPRRVTHNEGVLLDNMFPSDKKPSE